MNTVALYKIVSGKWLFLTLLATLSLIEQAEPSQQIPSVSTTSKMRLCGDKLVTVLGFVCNNCFEGGYLNAPETAKRNSHVWRPLLASKIAESSSGRQESEEGESDKGAHSVIRQHFEKRATNGGGISDECCLKQCTYGYLRTYCRNDCPHLLPTTRQT